ncbi:QRFP-like peptide receptor [Tubulanus polymorphus]|uniref:QRFP-like peptide receptor n=1 Tax=Tubulanus polymorphus TaxID=672921 RepID=UPI003DA64CFA
MNSTLNTTQNQQLQINLLLEGFRDRLYIYTKPTNIVLISVYIPLFVMAFFGNFTILIVVLPKKNMRNVTNVFLVNLAVADLLVTCICIPMAVGQSIYKVWIYGFVMCKFTAYLQGVSVSASVTTLCVMSLERLLAIRHPMTFRRVSKSKYAKIAIVILWLISLAIMLPLMLVRQTETTPAITELYSEPIDFCTERWWSPEVRRAYSISLLICVYIIPGVIITASYSLIGCQLLTGSSESLHRQDSKALQEQNKSIMRGRRKVSRMLMFLAILFAVCWMPYNIVSLSIDLHDYEFGINPSVGLLSVLPFTLLLGHSNSALNPLLYWFMNRSFRRSVKKKLGLKVNINSRPSYKTPASPSHRHHQILVKYSNDKSQHIELIRRPNSTWNPASRLSSMWNPASRPNTMWNPTSRPNSTWNPESRPNNTWNPTSRPNNMWNPTSGRSSRSDTTVRFSANTRRDYITGAQFHSPDESSTSSRLEPHIPLIPSLGLDDSYGSMKNSSIYRIKPDLLLHTVDIPTTINEADIDKRE